MVLQGRIERPSSDYKALILPLNYKSIGVVWGNRTPIISLEGWGPAVKRIPHIGVSKGTRTPTSTLARLCTTFILYPHWRFRWDSNPRIRRLQLRSLSQLGYGIILVEPEGVEPSTSCLQGRRSPGWTMAPFGAKGKTWTFTLSVISRMLNLWATLAFGGLWQTWTAHAELFRLPLYRMS